ncbi:hypothetical protein BVY03_02810 [bacterium K02(2017)]|nr:hypothetical protein BVY03_02810 [bacterium K02(2017)]
MISDIEKGISSTLQLSQDLELVSPGLVQKLIQENKVMVKSITEYEWEQSEIIALKRFIQSVQDQIYEIRKDCIEITKDILWQTQSQINNSNSLNALSLLIKHSKNKKAEIDNLKADLRLFEKQLHIFRISTRGFVKMGKQYVKYKN